jgi:predicted nuclease of restriction endonuclease-like RecB superfamily
LRNKFEEYVYKELTNTYGKANVEYEVDQIDYVTEHFYTPDFTVKSPNGMFFVEAKGFLRPEHRRVLTSVKLCNPDIDLRMYFQADKKVYKNGKLTYTQWADKYGLPWTVR